MRRVIFSLLFVAGVICADAQTSDEVRVLFVGNSYTYFWNLPQHVALFAEGQEINLTTIQSTAGGATLGQHWRGEKELNTRQMIVEGDFDIVVLQDHSRSAIDQPDSLHYYGGKWAKVIRENGGEPMLYMTWAREWDPYMQEQISHEYIKLGEKMNARVAPVGLAWNRARELRPHFDLYDPDGSHPSILGTYLTACVFYGMLTGQSPVGISNRLVTKDQYGQKTYINLQSANDALFCQKVALEVLQQMPD